MRFFVVCTILVFCCSAVTFGQNYQRSFNAENRFGNDVAIPANALRALKQDKRVQECIDIKGIESFSTNWFRAVEINLNDDKKPDLIVESNNSCLSVMNNRLPYWILFNKGKNYDLVLSANTISLYINKERQERFYNITIDWATANTFIKNTFGFDGKKYVEIASIEKPVKY